MLWIYWCVWNMWQNAIFLLSESSFFVLLLVSVWLLFKGNVYFLKKKPAAINDGWILRCIQAMQWWPLDAVSSTLPWASQSCCQPWEWDLPTQRALALVIRNYLHMCACTAYTNCCYYPRAVFILLRASDDAATIWGVTFIRRNMSIISSRDSYISHYLDRQDR